MTNPWLNIHYADTGSADRTPSLIRIAIGKYFVHVKSWTTFLPGAGNYGMCGRGFHPRFCFSWPNAKTAVMDGEQAARTMAMVTEAAMKRKGGAVDEAKLDELQRQIIERFESQMSVFETRARLLDDGVIDPLDTRAVLCMVLSICREASAREPQAMQFSVARP